MHTGSAVFELWRLRVRYGLFIERSDSTRWGNTAL